MTKRVLNYQSEAQLVSEFCEVLESAQNPWGQVLFTKEFNYSNGRTDIVIVDENGKVIAIEAKLRNWRDAIQQAYRNTCFAHQSYVLLPERWATHVAQHSYELSIRSIGVCYIDDGSLVIVVPAPVQEPIQPWLSEVAKSKVGMQNDTTQSS